MNTGPDVLVTLFCYPADSGQNYEIIARTKGLKVLIVDDHAGGWREIPNPEYRSRSEEQVRNWARANVREARTRREVAR